MRKFDLSIKITDHQDRETARRYLRTQSPEDRISAVEVLRVQYYRIRGYRGTPRIIRSVRLKTPRA